MQIKKILFTLILAVGTFFLPQSISAQVYKPDSSTNCQPDPQIMSNNGGQALCDEIVPNAKNITLCNQQPICGGKFVDSVFYCKYTPNTHALSCNLQKNSEDCLGKKTTTGVSVCVWNENTDEPTKGFTSSTPDATAATKEAVKKSIEARYGVPDGYYEKLSGIIPKCGFSGQCREVNVLLEIVINIGKYAFSLIGMVAFVAFVYGGFVMIFSFGNSDKVNHGKEVMIAAVVGLVIAFSAYAAINFLLDALGVQDTFKGISK